MDSPADGGPDRPAAPVRLLPCGDRAVLAELASADDVAAVVGLDQRPAGVAEVVPGARTVLVRFDPARVGTATIRAWLTALADTAPKTAPAGGTPPTDRRAAEVVIDVRYDGPDLADVAAHCGLTPAEVVARHTAGRYRVAFCGFAPGFGYLTGLDPALRTPRRPTPRVRVPAGSVGIAGDYTGAYPRASPGGWQLIGRTDAVLFDPDSERPVLLSPGTRVRFAAADR
jgi:KipI family sensor histidine kinase inhibitor